MVYIDPSYLRRKQTKQTLSFTYQRLMLMSLLCVIHSPLRTPLYDKCIHKSWLTIYVYALPKMNRVTLQYITDSRQEDFRPQLRSNIWSQFHHR